MARALGALALAAAAVTAPVAGAAADPADCACGDAWMHVTDVPAGTTTVTLTAPEGSGIVYVCVLTADDRHVLAYDLPAATAVVTGPPTADGAPEILEYAYRVVPLPDGPWSDDPPAEPGPQEPADEAAPTPTPTPVVEPVRPAAAPAPAPITRTSPAPAAAPGAPAALPAPAPAQPSEPSAAPRAAGVTATTALVTAEAAQAPAALVRDDAAAHATAPGGVPVAAALITGVLLAGAAAVTLARRRA